jgi:hypothetical protein
MNVPANDGYIGRLLLDFSGNLPRGRERNKDAVFFKYTEGFRTVQNLITNQIVHGTSPTLISETLGEII